MFWQLDWCPVFGVSGSRCNMRASILVGVRTEPSLKLCGPRGLDTFPFVVEFCTVWSHNVPQRTLYFHTTLTREEEVSGCDRSGEGII